MKSLIEKERDLIIIRVVVGAVLGYVIASAIRGTLDLVHLSTTLTISYAVGFILSRIAVRG